MRTDATATSRTPAGWHGLSAELREQLDSYRPELEGTPQARAAARFVLLRPPVPLALRPAYGVLAAASVSLLPVWTRWPLRLPYLPLTEAVVVRSAGGLLTRSIRWAMTAPAPTTA
jgi:uncharacterized protein (DUF2236 family)